MPARLVVLVLTQALAVLALGGWTLAGAGAPPSPPGRAAGFATEGLTASDATTSVAGPQEASAPERREPVAPPRRVEIPAVGIEADTIALGKTDDGRLEVPADPHTAGWWSGGVNPGGPGPAVIVAHVDSWEGPGAFYDLEDVEVGDRSSVRREDGSRVDFRVQRVERHPKDDFPTDEVYGPTAEPTLRLITCSGAFDPQARSYTDNVIVFLELDDADSRVVDTASRVEAASADEPAARGPAPTRRPGSDERSDALPVAVAVLTLAVTAGAVGREQIVRRRAR